MSLTRIILFAVLTLGATAASASDLGRDDFGYGITLRVDGAAPTYRVAVPLHVYQHTVRSDLGDIRVMNGSGEIVPYALRHAAGVAQSRAAAKLLPLFPLRGTSTEPSASLKLRLQSGNASIDIERPAVGAAMTRINGYLLDARSVTEALSTLEINWASDAGDFSSRLQLEASDDLNTWRAVADGPIINLHYAGQQFQQRRLDTPRVSARFFRLSWTDEPPAIEITSVSVEPALAQQDVKRLTFSAPATAVTAEPGTYLVDLGANIPLDRVNLDLPQINTIATVSFEARNDATADWRQVSRASLTQAAGSAMACRCSSPAGCQTKCCSSPAASHRLNYSTAAARPNQPQSRYSLWAHRRRPVRPPRQCAKRRSRRPSASGGPSALRPHTQSSTCDWPPCGPCYWPV